MRASRPWKRLVWQLPAILLPLLRSSEQARQWPHIERLHDGDETSSVGQTFAARDRELFREAGMIGSVVEQIRMSYISGRSGDWNDRKRTTAANRLEAS